MANDGEGTSTYGADVATPPFVALVRNPANGEEDTYFDQLFAHPDRYEITATAGTCADSDGTCGEATSCSFEFKLILDCLYTIFLGTDESPPIDPDNITVPVLAVETWPIEGTPTVTASTPEVEPGLFPGSYDAHYEVTITQTIEPGCTDIDTAVTFNWGSNYDVSATGGDPGGEGGNSWEVDNDNSTGMDGSLEEEVKLSCAKCLASSAANEVTQSSGKNKNPLSITNTVGSQQ